LTFDKRIDEKLKSGLKNFASWLRENYYFPIRCDVHVGYYKSYKGLDGDSVVGGFYYYDEGKGIVDKLPTICMAGLPTRRFLNRDYLERMIWELAYHLTKYYQWYFLEINERSERSLKIEATKWANYITGEYIFGQKAQNKIL